MSDALVVGPADSLRADLAMLEPFDWTPVVLAVNDAAWIYEAPIGHLVSIHSEKIEAWRLRRYQTLGRWDEYETWGPVHKPKVVVDHTHPHWGAGSSSLFAVTIALEALRCERVVLAGVPLESSPYAVHAAGTWDGAWPQAEVDVHRPGWEYHQERDRLRAVRSCSGWTRELLGGPEEWFDAD